MEFGDQDIDGAYNNGKHQVKIENGSDLYIIENPNNVAKKTPKGTMAFNEGEITFPSEGMNGVSKL